jgi:arsenate reductase
MKKNVLFVRIHNRARSQMAEAFLNQSCAGQFTAYGAGLEPGQLNPIVVQTMREIGLDLSGNQTKSVTDRLQARIQFDFVITVCDEAGAERCPFFPGGGQRLHWSFPNPSPLPGPASEKLAATRDIRDAIKEKINHWCAEFCDPVAA